MRGGKWPHIAPAPSFGRRVMVESAPAPSFGRGVMDESAPAPSFGGP
jgi:hypothetical protein